MGTNRFRNHPKIMGRRCVTAWKSVRSFPFGRGRLGRANRLTSKRKLIHIQFHPAELWNPPVRVLQDN
jgi:hypothetical protein